MIDLQKVLSQSTKYDWHNDTNIYITTDDKGNIVLKSGKRGKFDYRNVEKFREDIDDNTLNLFIIAPQINSDPDWAGFLNYLSNKGYKTKLIIYEMYDEVNTGAFNIFHKILQDKNLIYNPDNITIGIDGEPIDYSEMSLKELFSIDDSFDLCAEDIKQHNLSPLETVLAAYKTVTFILDTQNDNNVDDNSYSFNMFFAIKDTLKIHPMCQSFAQMFMMLCEKLNIECDYYSISVPSGEFNGSHAVNTIRIVDDKYGLDDNYLFDPTLGAAVIEAAHEKGRDINRGIIGFGSGKTSEILEQVCPGIVEENIGVINKRMKLAENGISRDIIRSALDVVNETFIENTKQTK